MTTVVIVYVLGLVVSAAAYNWRAGLPILATPFSGHKVTARCLKSSRTGNLTGGAGMHWWLARVGKQLGWPVIFVVWLVKGRPEPGIQFNELAAQRFDADFSRSRI